MMGLVKSEIADYLKYPPRQKPTSFNLDKILAKLDAGLAAKEAAKAEPVGAK
jgi:hypothetical protein